MDGGSLTLETTVSTVGEAGLRVVKGLVQGHTALGKGRAELSAALPGFRGCASPLLSPLSTST
jgi:hypothetical protein